MVYDEIGLIDTLLLNLLIRSTLRSDLVVPTTGALFITNLK